MVHIAIVPIGGVGSRLYPLTVDTSKAMVRFLNRPILDFIVTNLVLQGIRVVYMGVSGYHNYVQVHDYFGTGGVIASRLGLSKDEVRIRYMPNVVSRGNAEAVYVIINYYEINEPVIITQCDNVFDGLNIRDLERDFTERNCDMSIVLYGLENIEDVKRYGVAEVRDGLIARFVEKPRSISEAQSKLINTGIYLVDSEKFKWFLEKGPGKELLLKGLVDFGKHVIPGMISHGFRICGYIMRGSWFDIGTPETYRLASFYYLRNTDPSVLGIDFRYRNLRAFGRSVLSRRMHKIIAEMMEKGELIIEGDVLVGRHTSLGRSSTLRNAIIDNYVVVLSNCFIEESIIMDRVYIGSNVTIKNSIIGRHVYIDDDAVIENSIIGNNVFIGRRARVINSKIWPGRYVPSYVTLTGVTLP